MPHFLFVGVFMNDEQLLEIMRRYIEGDIPNKRCGRICAKFRTEVLLMTQEKVAKILDYSQENISAFENGRNNSFTILEFYLDSGLLEYCSINDLLERSVENGCKESI